MTRDGDPSLYTWNEMRDLICGLAQSVRTPAPDNTWRRPRSTYQGMTTTTSADHQGLSIRHSADWRGEAVVVHPTGAWMTTGEELVAGKFIVPPSADVPSAVVVASVAVAARAHATSTFVAFFTITDGTRGVPTSRG